MRLRKHSGLTCTCWHIPEIQMEVAAVQYQPAILDDLPMSREIWHPNWADSVAVAIRMQNIKIATFATKSVCLSSQSNIFKV